MSDCNELPPRCLALLWTIAVFVLGVCIGYFACYRDLTGHTPPPGDFAGDAGEAREQLREK